MLFLYPVKLLNYFYTYWYFWDVLKPPNSKSNIFHEKSFPVLLEIWFGLMRSAFCFCWYFTQHPNFIRTQYVEIVYWYIQKLLKLYYNTTWTSYEMLIAMSVFSSSRPRVITKWYCSLLSRESSNCLTLFSELSFLFLLIISRRFHNSLAIALSPRFSRKLYTVYVSLYNHIKHPLQISPSMVSVSSLCNLCS